MGFIRDTLDKLTGETARREAEAERASQEHQAQLETRRAAAVEQTAQAERQTEAERARPTELRQAREKDPGPAARYLGRDLVDGLNRGTQEPTPGRDATRLEHQPKPQRSPDMGGGMRTNSRAGFTPAQLEAQEERRLDQQLATDRGQAKLHPLDEAKLRLAAERAEKPPPEPTPERYQNRERRPPWDDGRGSGGDGRKL